jgi:protein dithiol oxidoreductase (disulfide-forming)
MKPLSLLTILLLSLVACGKDETPQPVAEQPVSVEETLVDENADTGTPKAAQASDETLEVVEESAAEPAPEEQAILLAQADTPAPQREWKYKEGVNYARLVPTQPTMGGADKIEVAEFFWYGCPHCYDLEPLVAQWLQDKPANVRFVWIPAMWNNILVLHAQLYYTEEVLERNGVIKDPAAFRAAVFQEYHRRGNRLASQDVIQRFFERFDVSADEFNRTWSSFEVAQKLRVAQDLGRRYSISGVPTIVVNGKYRTGGREAGGYPNLFDVVNELVARESLH